jgi:hypothetical protein
LELNPVENIWQYLRANYLSNRVLETYAEIIDAACDAWNRLIAGPDVITSIGMRHWAHIGRLWGPLIKVIHLQDWIVLFVCAGQTVRGCMA